MQLAVPSVAAGVSLVAAGVIAVAPAAPLPTIGVPAVQLTAGEGTADNLADLLNTASTNYTDAYNVAQSMLTDGLVQVGNSTLYQEYWAQADDIPYSQGGDGNAINILGELSNKQDTIASHAGSLSGLLDQVWFTPLDQEEVSFSAAVLNADQAFDTAVADTLPGATSPALEAAEQTLSTLGFEQIFLDWQTVFVADVANLLG